MPLAFGPAVAAKGESLVINTLGLQSWAVTEGKVTLAELQVFEIGTTTLAGQVSIGA